MDEELVYRSVMVLRNLAETARDINDPAASDPARFKHDLDRAWELLNLPEVKPMWLPGMKIKTADLTGPALDWAVATCEGMVPSWNDERFLEIFTYQQRVGQGYCWSKDWSQAGPIIERERIRTEPFGGGWLACIWNEDNGEYHLFYRASTPLIAAMRCFVASKMGDEIDVPEELA